MAKIFLMQMVVLSVVIFLQADCDAQKSLPSSGSQILVPAYFYPQGTGLEHWNQLIEAASATKIIAIVNPASGPGKQVDVNYQKMIARAQKAGVKLIGYVSTRYSKRDAEEVKADISQWKKLYPTIQGIFFDEQASQETAVAYYLQISKYARSIINKPLIVANPGVFCDEKFFTQQTADAYCVFENKTPFKDFKIPIWAIQKQMSKCYVLIYKLKSRNQMQKIAQQIQETGIGYYYITDDAGDNPWDTLPVHWKHQITSPQLLR